MFNFKIKNIEDISPIGQEGNLRLSWFWLTDGELWIDVKGTTLYEYTTEALKHFGKETPYNDYYLVRFIEDFTKLFEAISINIPKPIFDLTNQLQQFDTTAEKWLDLYETDDEEYSDFYFEEYNDLNAWRWSRTMNSIHLMGGPHFSFFRNDNCLRFVWNSDKTLENGDKIWKSKSGYIDMEYDKFVEEVQIFKDEFFTEMFERVKSATKKEWKNVALDKGRLMQEHFEREKEFQANISLLQSNKEKDFNWKKIEELVLRMKSETK